MTSIIPDLDSQEPVKPKYFVSTLIGLRWKTVERRESSVFRRKAKVSKSNASARMTLLLEAGHLINPSLACPSGYEGREKGRVSENFL
jgi:hypothetical protein